MHVDAYDWISALYSGLLIAMLSAPSFDKGPDHLDELPQLMKEGYVIAFNRMKKFAYALSVRKTSVVKIRQHSHEQQTFLYQAIAMIVFYAAKLICTFCN